MLLQLLDFPRNQTASSPASMWLNTSHIIKQLNSVPLLDKSVKAIGDLGVAQTCSLSDVTWWRIFPSTAFSDWLGPAPRAARLASNDNVATGNSY